MAPRSKKLEGVDIYGMLGVWYIVRTDLDFWRTRRNPSVTYTLLGEEPTTLRDTVRYGPRGEEPRTVEGFDVRDPDNPSAFLWRGSGLMTRFLTSRWSVIDHDGDYSRWAVTSFEKTPFTEAGTDLYTRDPGLSEEEVEEVMSRLRVDRASTLFAPVHEPPHER